MPVQSFRPRRSCRWPLVAMLGLAAAFPAAAGEIVLYEYEGFGGASFVADQAISNFGDLGFNDRASSVVIRSGSWQLCTDANFRGRCVTLASGEYPSLRSMALENQVSSVRELDRPGGGSGPRAGNRVELYAGDRFDGRVFAVDGPVANFPNDFNDRARSMIVHDGQWEVCTDIDYRGSCQTFGPGRYPGLGGMSSRVSSIRPAAGPGPAPGARVELFAGSRFDGPAFAVNGPIANFPIEFNDRARSMIVYDGQWEVCADIEFRGSCQSFGPGRYPGLGDMSGRVSSIRPVGGRGPGPGAGPGVGGWGRGSRAVLYEHRNFGGRSFVVNGEVLSNLDAGGFNDRASSLRVEGGYWIFCSDVGFRGQCQTFGPGDYPTLPPSLNNSISSGRRIHDRYPYNQRPNW